MTDRPSRPHTSLNRTPRPVERRVLHLRRSKRLGPVRIAWRLGLAASTRHAILRRAGAVLLTHLDQATAVPIRRYAHGQPMLKLAEATGMRTVAEGIENSRQAEALRRLGCQRGQGYYWSRPVALDTLQAAVDALPNRHRQALEEAGTHY